MACMRGGCPSTAASSTSCAAAAASGPAASAAAAAAAAFAALPFLPVPSDAASLPSCASADLMFQARADECTPQLTKQPIELNGRHQQLPIQHLCADLQSRNHPPQKDRWP